MLKSGYILDNKYEVISVLGKGGMGTVYLCKNIRLGNLWAIKEISKELKQDLDFLAEPNILKKLNHHGIPRIVDIFIEKNNLYMVEDYIEGENLDSFIENKKYADGTELLNFVLKLCEIIKYLHSFNPPIIYRDLKPSNIMITPSREIMLIDFGISRVYKQHQEKDTVLMGSMGYAAPEQFGTAQSTVLTDIYGIGAVMFFMFVGRKPLTLIEAMKDESYGDKIDQSLRDIIKKSMQIEPENRFSSVDELINEINKYIKHFNDFTRTELLVTENINVEPGNIKARENSILDADKAEKIKFSHNKDLEETKPCGIKEDKSILNFGENEFIETVLLQDKKENKASNNMDSRTNRFDKDTGNVKAAASMENKVKVKGNPIKRGVRKGFVIAGMCILIVSALLYYSLNQSNKDNIDRKNNVGESTNIQENTNIKPDNANTETKPAVTSGDSDNSESTKDKVVPANLSNNSQGSLNTGATKGKGKGKGSEKQGKKKEQKN